MLIATLIACIKLTDTVESSLSDQLIRLAWLVLAYTAYLGGFAMLALAISAFSRNSRTALVGLLAFWLANCFLVPRLMTDIVRTAQQLPTALEFRQAIAEEKKKTFGHDESQPAYVAFRDDVLRQYGVSRIEDLPVNFRGLALRKDDENGYRIFDQQYGALQEAYERQNRLRALPGFIFPLLAIQPLSMGMAGTDGRAQFSFTTSAEQHRRVIQTVVSDDLIRNGRYGDPTYVAGPELWQRIPGFSYHEPAVSWVLPAQLGNFLALSGWMIVTTLLAVYAVRRMRPI
jgi:ABC-2 type transport system permease protein